MGALHSMDVIVSRKGEEEFTASMPAKGYKAVPQPQGHLPVAM